MKEAGQVRKVIVTGCLAQRYADDLAEQLPEADLVVGFEKYGGLSGALRGLLDAPPEVDLEQYAQRSRVQASRGGGGGGGMLGVWV